MLRRLYFSLLFAAFISVFITYPSEALEIPDKPDGYVNDYAMLMQPTSVVNLNNDLKEYESQTSNQIVVAIFNSLEGESLEDFSIRLADKWKIGSKERDNGIILLIFKKDKKIRIEVGYGLEGVVTDAIASRVINQILVPSFRKAEFDQGVFRAVGALIDVTKGEYSALEQKNSPEENVFATLFAVLIIFLTAPLLSYIFIFGVCVYALGLLTGSITAILIIFFLVIIQRMFYKTAYGQVISSKRGWTRSGGVISGFGRGFSGGGGRFGGGGSSGSW